MGLLRQVSDIDIVFQSHDELTSNTIAKADIQGVRITEQDLSGGTGTIALNNLGGQMKDKFFEGYTAEVRVQYAGGAKSRFWLGRVLKKYPAYPSHKRQNITAELMDEGTYILTGATTTSLHAFGSVDAGAIVKDLIDTYCSDITTTNVSVTTGRTISISIPVGRNIMDTIRELMEGTGYSFRVDENLNAYLIARAAGTAYTLTSMDARNFTVDRDIQSVKNVVTVKGAFIADATATRQEGPATGYWSVDNSTNRRMTKFTPSGTVVQASVTAYNSTTPLSTHNLLLRIQPDDGTGTGPVAVDNYSADIAGIFIPNATIPTLAAASVGGVINASPIAGVTDYWLIVESDSASGDLLTVAYVNDGGNKLIYECYTREELTATKSDATSQGKYGPRKYTHIDRTLTTGDEVEEKAEALLAEYKEISQTISCSPEVDIFSGAHARVGDKVTTTLTDEGLPATDLSLISITWDFSTGNGVWMDINQLTVADTSPALTDADWAAQVGRMIGTVANNVSVLEAAVAQIGVHGWDQHSSFALAEINAKLTDATLDDADDPRNPKSHSLGTHSATTLAGLNALLSDATLDDSSSSRPPAAHDLGGAAHGADTIANLNAKLSDGSMITTKAGEVSAMTDKATPADADLVMVEDSAASNAKKKLTMANLKTYCGGGSGGDGTAVVMTCKNNTGATITKGSLCYISGVDTDPEVTLARGNAVATTRGMMVMANAAVDDAATGEFMVIGPVTGFSGLTAGQVRYLDPSTAGGTTATIPTTTGQFVRIVGYAVTDSTFYFHPDGTYIKVA